MSAEADLVGSALVDVAQAPAEIQGDAGRVKEQSLSDLIAAEKYLRGKSAAATPRRGLRFTQISPPGAV